jgi:hypothetical protein
MDTPEFEDRPARRIDLECPHCHSAVQTPEDEPMLVTDTKEYAPHLVAFRCPKCNERIRLDNRPRFQRTSVVTVAAGSFDLSSWRR